MACDLTQGRDKQCKDITGGLRFVDFINWPALVTFDADDLVTDITDIDGVTAITVYRYMLQGNVSNLEETVTSSAETGTTFWAQVLNMTLQKLSAITRKEVKLMAYGTPLAVIADNNANALLVGATKGLDTTGGTIVTGAALADLSGYTLVLTGNEPQPANFLTGSTLEDIYEGLTTAPTIVTGTVV